jgi:hypothetical protein
LAGTVGRPDGTNLEIDWISFIRFYGSSFTFRFFCERKRIMNAYLKKTFVLAAVSAVLLVFVASSWAQSYLDGSAKARGDYGQLPRISRSISQPTFQAAAPRAERSFSYEPAPAVKTEKAKSNPSAGTNAMPNATANNRSTRSFSYDPAAGENGAVRTRSSSVPLYLLPKSDARKFGSG